MNRKHRSQSTSREIESMERMAHAIRNWNLTDHARERASERGCSQDSILVTLREGIFIEAHQDAPSDLRAVYRHDIDPWRSCVVVVSLTRRVVVSAWVNATDDNHNTLDLRPYQWHTDLRETIRPFASNNA